VVQRLLTPALGRTLLAFHHNGQTPAHPGAEDDIIAMGNLMYDGAQAEIGLLVRDDWQRQGLGTLLAQRLVTAAGHSGVNEVRAHTRVHNTAIARTLRSAGLSRSGMAEPGEWSWSRTIRSAGRHGRQTVPEYETGS
jgi:RimJ/RimL family protein N-acetyltransferase